MLRTLSVLHEVLESGLKVQQRYLVRNVVQLEAADTLFNWKLRIRCSIGSCGLSETLFDWELQIVVNVVQLEAADTLFNWKLRIVRNVVQLRAADFQKVVQLGAADFRKRYSIGTTCPDAANDLCRPHVPFVRCDKGCPR